MTPKAPAPRGLEQVPSVFCELKPRKQAPEAHAWNPYLAQLTLKNGGHVLVFDPDS
jgi:hypothetical protein